MIFYFSGTGNSEYVAKRIVGADEQLVSIADAMKSDSFSYDISADEAVGFVFPVYFYTVPTIVENFIKQMRITGQTYVYALITCGGGIGQAGSVLKKLLAAKGISLQYVQSVLMPDNSMLFYQIPGVDQAKECLENADALCEQIAKDVLQRKTMMIGNNTVLSDVMKLGYKACRKTGKFAVLDSCISCGKCAANCPEGVIELADGKPVWTKEKCCKCSSCINRCPVQAIQYGKATIKRNRYVNPEVE